jgi:CheY-like chemotaxis protein
VREDLGFGQTPIVLLTPAARRLDSARLRELAVSGVVTKPIRQSRLQEAIWEAMGGKSSTMTVTWEADRRAETPAPGAAAPAAKKSLRILLAEDNTVNQKFAVRLLNKLGHEVLCVGNGAEAVAAWRLKPFDMVLMDVQMPEMDGFEATAEIRRQELEGSLRRTPIIAMTAHAMFGYREKCLEGGMDGYVTKPIEKDLLVAELRRVMLA